jgi:hypothetical protein
MPASVSNVPLLPLHFAALTKLEISIVAVLVGRLAAEAKSCNLQTDHALCLATCVDFGR